LGGFCSVFFCQGWQPLPEGEVQKPAAFGGAGMTKPKGGGREGFPDFFVSKGIDEQDIKG